MADNNNSLASRSDTIEEPPRTRAGLKTKIINMDGVKQGLPSVRSIRSELAVDDASSDSESETVVGLGRPAPTEAANEFRYAWLWAEGWRARLRKCGDIIEKQRWEGRLEDSMGRENKVPIIVARQRTRRREKSVHWA